MYSWVFELRIILKENYFITRENLYVENTSSALYAIRSFLNEDGSVRFKFFHGILTADLKKIQGGKGVLEEHLTHQIGMRAILIPRYNYPYEHVLLFVLRKFKKIMRYYARVRRRNILVNTFTFLVSDLQIRAMRGLPSMEELRNKKSCVSVNGNPIPLAQCMINQRGAFTPLGNYG